MIAVTGATGHLGRLAIENLLDRGVAAGEIVALARDPARAPDIAALSVQARHANYDEPSTLVAALGGVDKLLFVSGSEVGQRARQHRNVIDAAREAGVGLIVYTSILKADTSRMQVAAEHKATEEMIRESGIAWVFLRNSWYIENYTDQLAAILEHGALAGSAGDGRVSAATRADYAAAAAAVISGDEHENRTYELGGDEAFTLAELAEEISRQSGREVVYRDLPEDAYAEMLVSAGVPEPYARVLADADRGLLRGELFTNSDDLRRLIGRPTTPMRDAVAAPLRARAL